MKKSEIEDFLDNNPDKTEFYISTLIDKCKEIDRQINLNSLFILISICLYYLPTITSAESIQFGPVQIRDISSIQVFIPLAFSYFILRFIILSNHKAEIHKTLNIISEKYFKNNRLNLTEDQMDNMTRIMLPISNTGEISKYNTKGILGCLGGILIFPIISLAIIPMYLEFRWIKHFCYNFDKLNFIQKTSIIFSMWICLIGLYHISQAMYNSIKENREK